MKNVKILFIFLVLLSVTSCIYEDYGHTSYRSYPRSYPSGPPPRQGRPPSRGPGSGHHDNRGPHGRNPHR